MKKITAIILALVMVLGMTASVFADDPTYSITVTNDNTAISINNLTYYATKLFDVTYSGTAYAYTIKTDNPFYTNSNAKAVLETYFTFTVTTDSTVMNVTPNADFNAAQARAMADALQQYIPAAGDSTPKAVAENETATITVPTAGYYLVTGTATAPENQTVTAAVALTTTDPAAEVKVKADVPSLDKEIVEGEQRVKEVSKAIGSTVNFKLTSDVPDMTGYTTYNYIVSDTMSSGLTFNNDVNVTIGGVEYTGFVVATAEAPTFTITFTDFIQQAANAGKEIVITYSATVNENALDTDEETNTASLKYSNNPYDKTKNGTTPEDIVKVYDCEIVIDKYTGEYSADATRLSDAKFVLVKKTADGESFYKYTAATETAKVEWVSDIQNATEVTTGTDGKASFAGLEAGTYYLRETEAPKGYNPLKEDVKVDVKKTETAATETAAASVSYEVTQPVQNNTGTELPSTGGMGTTIFYVLGSIMLIGAAVVLVAKKRMSAEN